jgi:hypothetical protein
MDQLFAIAKEMSTSLKEALPPDDTIDLVRALFFLGHISSDYYGYGEFLIRFGLQISPMDPMLYQNPMKTYEEVRLSALCLLLSFVYGTENSSLRRVDFSH